MSSKSQYVGYRVIHGLVGLLCGLVGLGAILILGCAVIPYIYRRTRQASVVSADADIGEDQRRWLYPYWSWTPILKRSLIYAPLWKRGRASSFRPLPTRLHAVCVASYFILNLAYITLIDWFDTAERIYSQLRKRSGTIAVANMLALIILAARNNPLIRLLNSSFDTCNFIHRWIGRTMILESVLHVTAYVYPKVTREGWAGLAYKIGHSKFITSGLVGFISLLLIFLLSLKPLRSTAYEAFKHLHIILAITFTGAIMAHCIVSSHMSQRVILITALALLCAERLTRLLLVYRRNFFRGRSTWAMVETIPGQPQACRVTMELPRRINIRPGMHSYLRFTAVRPRESHPFSIAWWEYSGSFDDPPSTTASFVISAQKGFTRDLFEYAKSQPGCSFRTTATLEGPYGGHHSLESYGHAVLFAAGSGITHQIAYVRHFLEGYETEKTALRRMVLIWAVRRTDSIEWIRPWLDTINHMRMRHPDILQLRMFVTGLGHISRHAGDGIGVEVAAGRPNIALVLESEALEQIGAMCVSVCGPGRFADDVRTAVRSAQRSQQDIDFVEERFGW